MSIELLDMCVAAGPSRVYISAASSCIMNVSHCTLQEMSHEESMAHFKIPFSINYIEG